MTSDPAKQLGNVKAVSISAHGADDDMTRSARAREVSGALTTMLLPTPRGPRRGRHWDQYRRRT